MHTCFMRFYAVLAAALAQISPLAISCEPNNFYLNITHFLQILCTSLKMRFINTGGSFLSETLPRIVDLSAGRPQVLA